MKNTDNIASEIHKFLKGSCSPKEFEQVISMLKNPNQNLGLRKILFKTWNELEIDEYKLSEEEKSEIRNALSGIHHQINLTKEKWESKSERKENNDCDYPYSRHIFTSGNGNQHMVFLYIQKAL
jgi:DNA phosphorothioation-dependent restriction protein DptG